MRTVFASKKLNVMFFAIGLLGFVGASAAYASQAFSNWKNTGTVNGYTYQNESDIDNSSIFAGSIALGLFGALTARNRRMTQVAVDPRPRQRRLPDDVVRAVQ